MTSLAAQWIATDQQQARPGGEARSGAVPRVSPERARAIVARLRVIARLMDNAYTIPGTNARFGLDPILGLAPGVGDALCAAISLYVVYEGYRLGANGRTLGLMLANVAIDALAGSVPVLGDLFDAGFKANTRNLRLLGITSE